MADGTSALDRGAEHRPEHAIVAEPPCPAPVRIGVPAFLVPKALGEVKELARMIALAEWAPDCYRDIDGNYLQPKIELAILHGATVGLGPIAAVHAIAVIGGTPSIWGDGALSVIEHSGLLEDMVEDYEIDGEVGLTAICTMKRRDRATPIVTRFSMAMAERAGLTRSEGPWQTYPERMLRMRARSWTMRDGFADVLRGLQLREEVEDYQGRGGALPLRTPPGRGSRQESLRRHSSPRPRRPTGSNGATGDRPIAVSEPAGRSCEDRLIAEPPPAEEHYTLIDADGTFVEVVGPDALRAGFEQMVLDKLLSRDQALELWESNKAARATIERLFGPEALGEAEEHLRCFQGGTNPTRDDHPRPAEPSTNTAAGCKGPEQDHPSESDRGLSESDRGWVLEINSTWGIQKIFQQYRAALSALYASPNRNQPAIAKFRQANIAAEQLLRGKLQNRMGPIDAIYQRAGLEP
jgi:hypothetical protein